MLPSIVFFGSSNFAAAVLADLNRKGFPVILVVTQPDKPYGRKGDLYPPPVKQEAEKLNLPIIQPKSLRRKSLVHDLKNLNYDFGVVCAYGKILPPVLLASSRMGFINTHASNLPRFRGAAPMERAIMAGDTSTAMCIMEVSEGLDEGDVYHKEVLPIEKEMSFEELQNTMLLSACKLLHEVLLDFPQFLAKKTPQKEEGIVYASKLSEEDGFVNLSWPGVRIYNYLRALSSSYGILFKSREGKKLAIFQGSFEALEHELLPGQVYQRTKKSLQVALKGGILNIDQLQLEGKKRLPIQAFLSGYRIEAGDQFFHPMVPRKLENGS